MAGFERTAPLIGEEPVPGYGSSLTSLKDVFNAIRKDESDHVIAMRASRGERSSYSQSQTLYSQRAHLARSTRERVEASTTRTSRSERCAAISRPRPPRLPVLSFIGAPRTSRPCATSPSAFGSSGRRRPAPRRHARSRPRAPATSRTGHERTKQTAAGGGALPVPARCARGLCSAERRTPSEEEYDTAVSPPRCSQSASESGYILLSTNDDARWRRTSTPSCADSQACTVSTVFGWRLALAAALLLLLDDVELEVAQVLSPDHQRLRHDEKMDQAHPNSPCSSSTRS